MKIHITNPGTRSIGMKVDGKNPKGWKAGDPVPQIQYSADFDERGNATVEDAAGTALVAAYVQIKEGHKKISASTSSREE
jgi:hypothetical protein